MKPTRYLPFASLLLLLTAPALADSPPAPIEHDFLDADEVEGNLPSTDLAFLRFRGTLGRRTLIRSRLTFVPEMLKSVENQ